MKGAKKQKALSMGSNGGAAGLNIIHAALDGNAELVRKLLKDGADINTVEKTRGFTCLHIACLNGDADLVDVLLEHDRETDALRFDLRATDPPRYAWQLAMSAHHYDIANLVDERGQRKQKVAPLNPKP